MIVNAGGNSGRCRLTTQTPNPASFRRDRWTRSTMTMWSRPMAAFSMSAPMTAISGACRANGGEPVRISNIHSAPFHYYLHGNSPDGQELAYVALEGEGAARRSNIFTIPASGGPTGG